MTSALAHTAAVDQVDLARYAPLLEAARLLRKNKQHLARRCKQSLGPAGLAIKATPPSGGKWQWYIARHCDPRLAGGKTGENYQVPYLKHYPPHKIYKALKKSNCVQRFRAARHTRRSGWREQITAELQRNYPELKISQRTLYRWDTQYMGESDLMKLIDKRAGSRKSLSGDAAAWDYFCALYLTEQARPALECWRLMKRYAAEQGLDWPCYGTCQRQLKRRFDAQTIIHAREQSQSMGRRTV